MVDDIHERYERMREQGVEFVNPPVEITAGANNGGFTCYFRDPRRDHTRDPAAVAGAAARARPAGAGRGGGVIARETTSQLTDVYRRMLTIRLFEERCIDLSGERDRRLDPSLRRPGGDPGRGARGARARTTGSSRPTAATAGRSNGASR